MNKSFGFGSAGFTIVELLVSCTVFAIIAVSVLSTYVALNSSASLAKKKSIALTLANSKIEELKSLPYAQLAAYANTSTETTINGIKYIITTNIIYVDDAFDGCVNSSTEDKIKYCRNYNQLSPPTTTDANGADYKLINVTVKSANDAKLVSVDSQVAASVNESSSDKGALKVIVTDISGNPVEDATVNLQKNGSSIYFANTDSSGIIIFYDLDASVDYNTYKVLASKASYSSLSTIAPPGGTSIPTYPNPLIAVQATTTTALSISPKGQYSMVVKAVDESDAPINGIKVDVKGGVKIYTNETIYSDNQSVTLSSSGEGDLTNLTPGPYIFCGDNGDLGCKKGGTTYYLKKVAIGNDTAVALPPNIFVNVPAYSAGGSIYSYNSNVYLQKATLTFGTSP